MSVLLPIGVRGSAHCFSCGYGLVVIARNGGIVHYIAERGRFLGVFCIQTWFL